MSITDHHGFETFNGFPMPKDPQALVDRDRRPIVRSATREPRFPFPVPNGWFIVAEARDLTPGEVRTFKVFGTDVVLFRGDDGAPHMVDAVLRAPRRAHRRRWPGRRRMHPVPVPRLALRRRHRSVQRDPVRRHGPDPEPGPDPRVSRASSATR